jgi:hypothetical protein
MPPVELAWNNIAKIAARELGGATHNDELRRRPRNLAAGDTCTVSVSLGIECGAFGDNWQAGTIRGNQNGIPFWPDGSEFSIRRAGRPAA